MLYSNTEGPANRADAVSWRNELAIRFQLPTVWSTTSKSLILKDRNCDPDRQSNRAGVSSRLKIQ
jgi:hypothetical protein